MNLSLAELRKQKVAVLGFGVEGRAIASFLNLENIEFDVLDESGKDGTKLMDFSKMEDDYDVYFKSPGIIKDRINNIPEQKVTNLTDLFLSVFPGRTIGVTGTKGKSTTSTLIDAILKSNNRNSYLVGNIGNYTLDKISDYSINDYAVMELSSFQLENVTHSPDVAIILPIIEDHLDHHKDLQEYFLAKANICKYQSNKDWVLVASDKGSSLVSEECKAKKIIFGAKEGCSVNDDDGVCQVGGKKVIYEGAGQFAQENLIPEIDMEAALSFMFVEHMKFKPSLNFVKPDFRIELVGEYNGAKFYNDSASTNPISATKALELVKGKKILLMGGKSKNLNFDSLFERLKDKDIELVILFGALQGELLELAKKMQIDEKVKPMKDIHEIFEYLRKEDLSNKSVIFSPAAASFDQFENAKQRGKIFNELFNGLDNASKI